MRFEPKGQALYITGKLEQYANQAELEDALRAAGCHITSDITLSTTALIIGAGWHSKLQQASARKLPVLTESQAKLMLEQGFIDLEDAAPAAELARDANISELRSALAQRPSSQIWDQVIEHIDRCPEEQLNELIDYIDAYTSRWEIAPDARWQLGPTTGSPGGEWNIYQPRGELRLAPWRWVADMLQGVDSPKYKILRGVTLHGSKAKNADVAKLVALPSLSGLTSLHLGECVSPTIWKRLLAGPIAPGLRRLQLARVSADQIKALQSVGHDALPSLKTLGVYHDSRYVELAALEQLLCAPWGGHITRLELDGGDYIAILDMLARLPALLPALDTLQLCVRSYISGLRGLLPATMRPVETLALTAELNEHYAPNMHSIFGYDPSAFEQLDLSGMVIQGEGRLPQDRLEQTREALHAAMLRELPGSPMAKQFARIKLGRWWREPLAAALTRHNIEAIP